jgi:hypothetical protein
MSFRALITRPGSRAIKIVASSSWLLACCLAAELPGRANATTQAMSEWLVSTDYSTIQDAINALPSAGGTVYIPRGTHVLTKSLYLPRDRPVRLIGAGPEQTYLAWTGDPGGDSSYIIVRYHNSAVEQLTITGTGNSSDNARGIYIDATDITTASERRLANFIARDLEINQTPSWGIEAYGQTASSPIVFSIYCLMQRVSINGNKKDGSIRLGQGSAGWTIRDCNVGEITGNGLRLVGATFTQVDACGFGSQVSGVTDPMIYLNGTLSVGINRCDIETNTTGYFVEMEGLNNGVHLSNDHFGRGGSLAYVRMAKCVNPHTSGSSGFGVGKRTDLIGA